LIAGFIYLLLKIYWAEKNWHKEKERRKYLKTTREDKKKGMHARITSESFHPQTNAIMA
jgi:hypothetical protein